MEMNETQRVKEMTTSNQESHFRHLILDNLPVAIVTMDADFKITSFNALAEHLTGFSATEALGQPCHEILQSNKCDSECPLRTTKKHGEAATGLEAEFVNHFQEHIPVRIGTATIKDTAGDFLGYLEAIEDISREKALEREKDNFQFMVAHDIKSPLIAMQGLIQRLREHHEEMPADKREQYLRIISEAGKQIEEQVMNFLEYARQATHKITLHKEETDITQLIETIIERHLKQAAEKNLIIYSEHGSTQNILVDSGKLQLVFENLLDNAIKFAHRPGEIIVRSRETEKEIIVQVQDNGPGIPAKELPFVFDAFQQSQSNSMGHGLGLASVKAIIQEHGGRVAVKSSPEKGSVFTIRLPKTEQ